MENILACDIVVLTETHAFNQDLSLPGFSKPFRRDRNISKRCHKSFGGIAVFIKDCLTSRDVVSKVSNDNPDVLWIKIKKEFLNAPNNLYVACAYLSPINKKNYQTSKCGMSRLRSDVELYKTKGSVFIVGDLNARTNSDSDFINVNMNNLCDDPMLHSDDHFLKLRNSEDRKKPCTRGSELLRMCREIDILILNGRTIGDVFGKITCFRSNGCSVVDYGLCSNDFYDKIAEFKVNNLVPWVSDHCPIEVTINTQNVCVLSKPRNDIMSDMPPQFLWNDESEQKVTKVCKSKTFKEKFNSLCNVDADNNSANAFTTLIQEVCEQANLSKTSKKVFKNKTDKIWFNDDCSNTKRDLRLLSKKLNMNPHNLELRKLLSQKKKEYKALISLSKKEFEDSQIINLSNNMTKSQNFWNLFKKLRGKKSDGMVNFQPETVLKYFSDIFGSGDTCNFVKDKNKGPLDSAILKNEIDQAIKKLKNRKSCGIDGISNEILLCIYNIYPESFLYLFNSILNSGAFPNEWKISLISPIHKKGSVHEISNYRGISLTPCISKLFESILNSRLLKWCTEQKIFSATQLGFIKGNRTSDAQIILHNLIDKYCHKKKKYIFSCFVDFEKAFDRVSRPLLFSKLKSYGLTGHFFNTICSMYCGNTSRVKLCNQMTTPFKVDIGVRQGCVLSPTLFNIFIADLCVTLDNNPENGLNLDDKSTISNITWADDIVLLSDTKEGLQKQLDQLSLFSANNHISININKTKCLCFNKAGALIRNCFTINGTSIADVKSFKYLGFLVNCNGNLRKGFEDLSSRANKAYHLMRITLGYAFRNNVYVTLRLFDALVKPILLYNSDFWGMCSQNQLLRNTIEKLCLKFYKNLLGVSPKTANLATHLELMRYPILIDAQKNCLNNWIRIHFQKSCNELLLKSYVDSITQNLQWPLCVKSSITEGNIGYLFNSTIKISPKSKIVDLFKQNLIDSFFLKMPLHRLSIKSLNSVFLLN